MFCHSKRPIMGRFLLRAQELNMTNGDFAFFTFYSLPSSMTDKPWFYYAKDKDDISRLQRVCHVVKQVCDCQPTWRSNLKERSCGLFSGRAFSVVTRLVLLLLCFLRVRQITAAATTGSKADEFRLKVQQAATGQPWYTHAPPRVNTTQVYTVFQ